MERPASDPTLPTPHRPAAAGAVKPVLAVAKPTVAPPHPPLPPRTAPVLGESVRSVGPSVRLEYEIWHPGLPKSPWFHTEKFLLSVNDQPEGDDGMNDAEERSSLDFRRVEPRRPNA